MYCVYYVYSVYCVLCVVHVMPLVPIAPLTVWWCSGGSGVGTPLLTTGLPGNHNPVVHIRNDPRLDGDGTGHLGLNRGKNADCGYELHPILDQGVGRGKYQIAYRVTVCCQ